MKRNLFARAATLCLVLAALGGCATISHTRQQLGYWGWQQKTKATLTNASRTEHFDIFSRPGSKSAAHSQRIGAAAEGELARICARLEVANDTRYTIFLFEDHDDLANITKVPNTGGFATGNTLSLIYGDAPARIHEMVHIVAGQKIPGHHRNMFPVEGLANALLDSVPGWDVHAVAKHYRQTNQLPGLREMTDAKDFYAWLIEHPNLNTYDIAGSWFKFLLDTRGVAQTKIFYGGKSAPEAFGASLESLEQEWLTLLDRYEPSEEIKNQVGLSNGRSPDRFTAVEGEAFSGRIDFALSQAPEFRPDGSFVMAYSGQFTNRKTLPISAKEAPEIKYAWLKNGVQMENAKTPVLEFGKLTLADSGTYVGVVGYKGGEAEATVLTAWVIMLTVVPESDIVEALRSSESTPLK